MMPNHKKHRPSGKIWIEYRGSPMLGRGGAEILREIEKQQSLSKATEKLRMSYRYVWSYVQKIHKILGEIVVETYKGGKSGGGGARLTDTGKNLLEEYTRLEGCFNEFLAISKRSDAETLKSSARNRFKAEVIAVEKGAETAKVRIEIKAPCVITSAIAKDAIEKLDLKVGDHVEAIVKSTDIMIGK